MLTILWILKIEYDLNNSNFDDLKIKQTTRIEQYGIPLTILWHPPITKEAFFLTFNDQVNYLSFEIFWYFKSSLISLKSGNINFTILQQTCVVKHY